tara:strand:- start:818 stop:1156 length:339 start_codon:yes stop_codon:yes gene_type:complete
VNANIILVVRKTNEARSECTSLSKKFLEIKNMPKKAKVVKKNDESTNIESKTSRPVQMLNPDSKKAAPMLLEYGDKPKNDSKCLNLKSYPFSIIEVLTDELPQESVPWCWPG